MEDNFIYDDLVSQGDLGDIIHNLQKRKNDLELHVASLEKDVKKLCDKITEMKAVQDNLSRNISELFKTAKNELTRKDRRIAELQAQLDDLVFRRNPTQSYDSHKRKREESNWEENNKKPKNEHIEVVSKSINNSNDGSDKGVHREDKRVFGRMNLDSNSHDSSRHENDRSGKTPYQRENSYKRERSSHRKEDDSHRSILDKVYADQNSQHEYDHNGKTYSRENSNRKDRNDDHRDRRRDSRDDNRDRRLSRRDRSRDNNREHFSRDHKTSLRGHRDKSRDYRSSIKDNQRSPHRESKNYRRDKSETRPENTKRITDYQRNEPKQGDHQRIDKIDEFHHFKDEPMIGDPKEEPVFSAAESSQTPSEEHLDREDGELSDDDDTCIKNQEKLLISNKEKSKKQSEKSDFKKITKDIERNKNIKMDLVNENIRLENVPEARNNIQKNESKEEKPKLSTKEDPKKHEEQNKQNSKLCTETDSSKNIEDQKVCTEKNTEGNKRSQDEIIKHSAVGNLSEKIEINLKEAKLDKEKNSVNVNIISQVILNKGLKEVPASSSNAKLAEQSKSQENKNKHSIIVPKLDRPKRESRVPRNLTDELNINLERSEKKQKLMSQLFGSSEKKSTCKPIEQFSPAHSVGLSHEGEIPNLHSICSSDPSKIKSDHLASPITTSNPVTEFQIFKTNLPSLEKSNSLTSIDVQIQTPDSSIRIKEVREKSSEKSMPTIVDKKQIPTKHKEISEKCISQQVLLSTQAITENVPQSGSDVCDVSFDLLNMDIAQCNADDFPNLIALSSKDMSDLLLTPKAPTVKKNPNINKTSVENLQQENESEKNHTNQSTEPEKQKTDNVSKKSPNIKNKDNKQPVMKDADKTVDETVKNKNSLKSPKKCLNDKKNTTNTNTKVNDNANNTEKTICNSQDLKNGEGSELGISDKIKTIAPKTITIKSKKSAKDNTNTTKGRKQNKANDNKKATVESIDGSLEKPNSISNKIADVKVEGTGNTVTNSENTKSINNSERRKKRCGVKWV